MINLIRRLFGLHVCGPFTPWVAKTKDRPITPALAQELGYTIFQAPDIKIVDRWQERACTTCGKIQQEDLRF